MNHSCAPNCLLQKWVVGQTMRVGIFLNKDLPRGTELTFDYKFERYGYFISNIRNKAQPCYCGEECCSGFIGGAKQSDLEIDPNASEEEEEEEHTSLLLAADDPETKNIKKRKQDSGLETVEQVQAVIKSLMYSATDAKKVLVKLNTIIVPFP